LRIVVRGEYPQLFFTPVVRVSTGGRSLTRMNDDIAKRVKDDIARQVKEIQSSDVFKRVKELQASMVESAKPGFDDSELGDLRCIIRLTMEFHHYLEHGSTEMVRSLQEGPMAHLFKDLQDASADPFNKYDLEYACNSIHSGVDSFCSLNQSYRILAGATGSKVAWAMISSRESFKTQFILTFNEFTKEANFENKCRLLLDLFKLQMVFASISYD
jgi:hypothetical protein